MLQTTFLSFLFFVSAHCQSSVVSNPLVNLDYGTFRGSASTDRNITSFLGIPYAKPPTGSLRFNLPQPPDHLEGIQNATEYGLACSQKFSAVPDGTIPGVSFPQLSAANFSEDCLFINVIKPAVTTDSEFLPVLFWIHGGGFFSGSGSDDRGDALVQRSVALNQPILHVSINYRLNAFGSLAGKEVKAANVSNIALHDQKFALEWVQKYIHLFGGDPKQVTIWGESAGADAVGMHLVSPFSSGLFRGAVFQSGDVPATLGDVGTAAPFQSLYDTLANHTNCSTASDTLECMRHAPLSSILEVVDATNDPFGANVVKSVFLPGVDGVFFEKAPARYVIDGEMPEIPILSGSVDDEGTFFAVAAQNVTTDEQFLAFVRDGFFPQATDDELEQIGQLYPDDPTQGSPYGTGTDNSIAPQYKRIASFHGDATHQTERRNVLKHAKANSWSYLFKRRKDTPTIGSYHAGDLPDFTGKPYVSFATNETVEPDFVAGDAMIFFTRNLNPNIPSGFPRELTNLSQVGEWKPWTEDDPAMLAFNEPYPNITLIKDDYRKEGMDLLLELYVRELP